MLNFFRKETARRSLQESDEQIDLVNLLPFDIQLARTDDTEVDNYDLLQIITDWMNGSYEYYLSNLGYVGVYADFNTVILLDRKERMLLEAQSEGEEKRFLQKDSSYGELFTAELKGAALFTKNVTRQASVPHDVVHYIQESTLNNETGLLELLQLSSAPGLGSLVVDINAFTVTNEQSSSAGNTGDDSLAVVIIVAIVVASVAFFFLIVAIVWAWRYDRLKRQAYRTDGKGEGRRVDPTGSNSTDDKVSPEKSEFPLSEIGGDSVFQGVVYPESVISEDISTSLSQYYRSGIGTVSSSAFAGRTGSGRMDHLNDAASISSMDSYGYSLDGYTPSMNSNVPKDIPVEPRRTSSEPPQDIPISPSRRVCSEPIKQETDDDLESEF